jgi:hypothetical protein
MIESFKGFLRLRSGRGQLIDDVRVLQLGDRARLLLKAPDKRRVFGELARQHFHRHLTIR